MTSLWRRALEAAPGVGRWLDGKQRDLNIGRLIRPAWPIRAGLTPEPAAAGGIRTRTSVR